MKQKLTSVLIVLLFAVRIFAQQCVFDNDFSTSDVSGISIIDASGDIEFDSENSRLVLTNTFDNQETPAIGFDITPALSGLISIDFTFQSNRGAIRTYFYVLDNENDTIAQMMIGDEGNSGGEKVYLITNNPVAAPSGQTIEEDRIHITGFSKNTDIVFNFTINTDENTISISKDGVDLSEAQNIALLKDSVQEVVQFVFATGTGYAGDATFFYLDDILIKNASYTLSNSINNTNVTIDSLLNDDSFTKDTYVNEKINILDSIAIRAVNYLECGYTQDEIDSVITHLDDATTNLLHQLNEDVLLGCGFDFEQDFESIDSILEGWTEINTTGNISIDTSATDIKNDSDNQSLAIDFTLDQPGIIIPFDEIISDNFELSFDFTTQRNTLRSYIYLLDSSDNVVSEIMIGNFAVDGTSGGDGNKFYLLKEEIEAPNGRPTTSQKVLMSALNVSNSAWRNISLDINFAEATISTAVDGETLSDAQNVPLIKTDASNISKLKIILGRMYADESTLDNIYFDNITIMREHDSYSLQSNIYECMLLSDSISEENISNIGEATMAFDQAILDATTALNCGATNEELYTADSSLQTAKEALYESLNAPTSINTINASAKIYPNPTMGEVTIVAGESLEDAYYIVYSITGQIITTGQLQNSEGKIDLSKANKGIYLLKIQNNEAQIIDNIVVK